MTANVNLTRSDVISVFSNAGAISTFIKNATRGVCNLQRIVYPGKVGNGDEKIKKNGIAAKFKIRCALYLYTPIMADKDKAVKFKQSLPPSLQKKEICVVSRE